MRRPQRLQISETRFTEYALISLIFGLSLGVRLSLLSIRSPDYNHFINPWYNFIVSHGHFAALRYPFSNYNVPYLYLLILATYLPIKEIVAVKAISIVFDYLLAFFVYRIVQLRYKRFAVSIFAAIVVVLLPTIWMNSALWAQCDAIYATLSVGGVYFLLKKRLWWACLFFGLAISFKLQAIFLFPLLFVLLIRRRIAIKHLLLIPVVYAVLLIPALLAGRGIQSLLLIYSEQAGQYPNLPGDAPDLFQWLPSSSYGPWHYAAILLVGAIILLISYLVLVSRKPLTDSLQIKLAFAFVLIVPFFLPTMHERYFYLADVLSLIYAFFFPRYFALAILEQISSLFSYALFLYGHSGLNLPLLSFFVFGAIVLVVYDLVKEFFFSDSKSERTEARNEENHPLAVRV